MTISRFIFPLLLVFCLAAASCNKETADNEEPVLAVETLNPMDDFTWMLGKWQRYQGDRTFYESWKRESDDKFAGKGVTIKGPDTTFVEYLQLHNTDSGLYYVAQVSHNPTATYFRMTSNQAGTTVFENPEHDFPTRIIYKPIGVDSMHARIEGEHNGEPAGVDFVFERVE